MLDSSGKENGDAETGEESEEREQVEDQFEEQYLEEEQEQHLEEERVCLNMEQDQYIAMEDEPPQGILNFRMCTALPKHSTRNITSIMSRPRLFNFICYLWTVVLFLFLLLKSLER